MNAEKGSVSLIYSKEEVELMLTALLSYKKNAESYRGYPSKEFRDNKVKEIATLIEKIKKIY